MTNHANIKSMKLYHQVDRVFNELRTLDIKDGDDIEVTTLAQFDQYHYLGTDAVDESIRRLGLSQGDRVVEIGGGIGGPARHLAHRCQCHVTALELQPDLNQTAAALTARCGLAHLIDHRCGDVLAATPDNTDGPFDALVSWLTFLHIPDRALLYRRCRELLKPGAGMYVEDYFARGNFSTEEKQILARDVFCERIPSWDAIHHDLEAAGFRDIELVDMTEAWTTFVRARLDQFVIDEKRNRDLHGDAIVDGLRDFYDKIARLYRGGNLGGLRLIARNTG